MNDQHPPGRLIPLPSQHETSKADSPGPNISADSSLVGQSANPLAIRPTEDYYSCRSLSHRLACPPRISLNGLLIGLLASLGLVALGFCPVALTSPLNWWGATANASSTSIAYTVQLPAALFASALLGPFMGIIVVLTYILAGLTVYPLFANGGGWHYMAQPGFGYWLGTAIACFGLSRIFHRVFMKDPMLTGGMGSSSMRLLRHSAQAILTIHVVGLLYMVLLALTGQLDGASLPGWALRLTLEPLPYDLLAVICLTCLVRPVRWLLWLVLY